MLRQLLILSVFLSSALLYAQNDNAYIKKDGNNIHVGNKYLERIINILPQTAGTIGIKNKISGKNYPVHSDEFELSLIWSGMGPAYSKKQNGESPVVLTVKDCKSTGYDIKEQDNGIKELILNFQLKRKDEKFSVNVHYEVYPDKFYMRKWIDVSDAEFGLHFLDRINVESLDFNKGNHTHGGFGQPVFNEDIFIGVEYPTVENVIQDNKIKCGYVVGELIKKNAYVSHCAVIGVSASDKKLENVFMRYVEDIKVNGTRPFLLYNSWYDIRNPEDIDVKNNPSSTMNIDNIISRTNAFKNLLLDKYDIALDAFVLDDGWDNINSYWDIDSSRFPEGFNPLLNPIKNIHSGIGLWSSPFGGYTNRKIRAKWANEHGLETTDDFLCFAGTNGKAKFKEQMVKLTKEYNVNYFKWDGFLLSCNETGHGHLPGVYSREANVSTYIDVMNAVRKINPDIYLNITSGTWLSPWWLKYADCIWMQGLDYAYAEDVPCIYERDKSVTYKDAILWDNYQNQHLLFPMSSLMTHGIIKAQLALIGGDAEAPEAFSNDVMMYFGRGVMMCELYVTPGLLSDKDWNSIASTIKWAKENKTVLENTKMILGDPLKREPYGYIHEADNKGILLLRNPDVYEKIVKIKPADYNGDLNPAKKYYVKIIFPYNMILPVPVTPGQEFKIALGGFEVLAAEIIPETELNKDLPAGIRYELNDSRTDIFSTPGNSVDVKSLNGRTIGKTTKAAALSEIKFVESTPAINNGQEFESHVTIKVSEEYNNSKFAFLLEPDEKIAKDARPEMVIIINGESKKIRVEEENGKWFWILTDLNMGENKITYKISFKDKARGKVSSFIFADRSLQKTSLEKITLTREEILPAKPYGPDIQKIIIPVKQNKI